MSGTTPLSMLEGAAAPEWLAADLSIVGELPAGAQAELWPALEATLEEVVSKAQEAALGEFCKRHGVEPVQLGRALKGLRYVFRLAAQTASPKSKLIADVKALLGSHAAVAEALVSRHYAPAMAKLEAEINAKTLAAQGKVLTGLDWSVATVSASSAGRGLKLPVVRLTLRYHEDGVARSITVSALPTVVRRVRDALSSLLE